MNLFIVMSSQYFTYNRWVFGPHQFKNRTFFRLERRANILFKWSQIKIDPSILPSDDYPWLGCGGNRSRRKTQKIHSQSFHLNKDIKTLQEVLGLSQVFFPVGCIRGIHLAVLIDENCSTFICYLPLTLHLVHYPQSELLQTFAVCSVCLVRTLWALFLIRSNTQHCGAFCSSFILLKMVSSQQLNVNLASWNVQPTFTSSFHLCG